MTDLTAKARALLDAGKVTPLTADRWRVDSSKQWTVNYSHDNYYCNCPANWKAHRQCSHIEAVKLFLAAKAH